MEPSLKEHLCNLRSSGSPLSSLDEGAIKEARVSRANSGAVFAEGPFCDAKLPARQAVFNRPP